MSIKTNNYSKSGSYSKPSTTTKAKTSSKLNSTTKNSSSTSKSTVNSSQKRDTFTNSSAKVQKTSKTTVKSTSTVNNSSKTAVSSKSSVQSKSNRDTFSCSAKMENLTRITKTSAGTTQKSNSVKNNKTSVSSKSNAAKTNTQAKFTPTKNNNTVTNKAETSSSKSKILESIQKQYEHTTDPKQKEAMKKTMNDIASGVSSKPDSVEKKLEELGIDLSKLHFGLNSEVKKAKLITNAQTFEVVAENSLNVEKEDYITQSEYERILYIITHENGTTENASTDMFATASALLNSFEAQYCYAGYGSISSKLSAFESNNAQFGLFDKNDGSAPNVQEL